MDFGLSGHHLAKGGASPAECTQEIHACMNRASYLVRKSPSFARSVEWLWRRLYFVLFRRNERIAQRLTKTKQRLK